VTAPLATVVAPAAPLLGKRPKLLFLVTEDWFFYSHRMALARAARDGGFEVVVAARVRDHGERIRAEGFRLCALPWQRDDGLIGAARAIASVTRLYRVERPDIVHHVALKAIVFGAIAVRLAFWRRGEAPGRLAGVMGLGSVFERVAADRRARFRPLAWALRLAMQGGQVTVENPENRNSLIGLGIDPARIALIRGSGVDTDHFAPLPDPPGPTVTVALVARMLRSKGVLDAVAAVRLLRARGMAIELVLAGPTDPDNRDSLDQAELLALNAEPGIEWLGRVEDVRTVWRRAAIAVLPSTYGEGVPKTLIEAAACARPIVATDMPGCREMVRTGETGLLVPPHDVAALAEALAALAGDAARRRAMGRAGRVLVEREFGEEGVARETLALYRTLLRKRSIAP